MALDYDPGMENPANAIVDEVYDVSANNDSVAVWPATDSGFFGTSITVYGSTTTDDPGEYVQLELYKDFTYSPANLKLSARAASWIYSYIVLLRPYNFIKWSYHGIGGPMDATLQAEIADASPFDVTDAGIWLSFQGQAATMDAVAIDDALKGLTPIEVLSNKLERIAEIMSGSTDQLHPTLQALWNQRESEWQVLQQQIADALGDLSGSGGDPRVDHLVNLSGRPGSSDTLGTASNAGFNLIVDNRNILQAFGILDQHAYYRYTQMDLAGYADAGGYTSGIIFPDDPVLNKKAFLKDGVHYTYVGGTLPYTTTGTWADERHLFRSVHGHSTQISHGGMTAGSDRENVGEVLDEVRTNSAKADNYLANLRGREDWNGDLLTMFSRATGLYQISAIEDVVGHYDYFHYINPNLLGSGTPPNVDFPDWDQHATAIRRSTQYSYNAAWYPTISTNGFGNIHGFRRAGDNTYIDWAGRDFNSTTPTNPNSGSDTYALVSGRQQRMMTNSFIASDEFDDIFPGGWTVTSSDIHPQDSVSFVRAGVSAVTTSAQVYVNPTSGGAPAVVSMLFDVHHKASGVFEQNARRMFTGDSYACKLGIAANDNAVYWVEQGVLYANSLGSPGTQFSWNILKSDGTNVSASEFAGCPPNHIVADNAGFIYMACYDEAEVIALNSVRTKWLHKVDLTATDGPTVVWSLDIPTEYGDHVYSGLYGSTGNLYLNQYCATLAGFHGGLNVAPDGTIYLLGNTIDVSDNIEGVMLLINEGGTIGSSKSTVRTETLLSSTYELLPWYNLYNSGDRIGIMGPPVGTPEGKGVFICGLTALQGGTSSQKPGELQGLVSGTYPSIISVAPGEIAATANATGFFGGVTPSVGGTGGRNRGINGNSYFHIASTFGPTGSRVRSGRPEAY